MAEGRSDGSDIKAAYSRVSLMNPMMKIRIRNLPMVLLTKTHLEQTRLRRKKKEFFERNNNNLQ